MFYSYTLLLIILRHGFIYTGGLTKWSIIYFKRPRKHGRQSLGLFTNTHVDLISFEIAHDNKWRSSSVDRKLMSFQSSWMWFHSLQTVKRNFKRIQFIMASLKLNCHFILPWTIHQVIVLDVTSLYYISTGSYDNELYD